MSGGSQEMCKEGARMLRQAVADVTRHTRGAALDARDELRWYVGRVHGVDENMAVRFPRPELRPPSIEERLRVYAQVAESQLICPPIVEDAVLDDIAGCRLHIQLENMQATGSIKDRAAEVVVGGSTDLPPGTRAEIATSGNHGYAYVRAADRRGLFGPRVTVRTPYDMDPVKLEKLRALRADVRPFYRNYDEAYDRTKRISQRHDGLYWDLSSHDSVAALGTAVMDLMERRPMVDAVVLPAGGGTVASAASIVRHYGQVWGKDYKIIVACPENAPTVYESFKAGRPVACVTKSAAGAVNVGLVDAHLLPEIIANVNDVVKVPDSWIKSGIPLLSDTFGRPVEGGGALAPMAVLGSHGVLQGATGAVHDLRGMDVATLVTGGNIDRRILDGYRVAGEATA